MAVSISQADTVASAFLPTSGLVTLTDDYTDSNQGDEHTITFDVVDAVFSEDASDTADNTFTFDPTGLNTGDYQVKVTTAETNTVELHSVEVITQLHVDLALTGVVADIDQDSILDSLDNNLNTLTTLPIDETGVVSITVPSGLELSLGDFG